MFDILALLVLIGGVIGIVIGLLHLFLFVSLSYKVLILTLVAMLWAFERLTSE